MEVSDPNLGGIVQYVTHKLNSMCVLVLLFIFKLHFLNTTVIVSLMDSMEYTYQGSYSGRLALGSPPRILGVE